MGLPRIHANGYAATGVKEVLEAADVPKGSFYHYFPSKEAFAREVLDLYASEEVRRAKASLMNKNASPLQRLERYFRELIAVYGRKGPIPGCLLGNMSLEVAEHSPAIQAQLSGIFHHWQGAIAAVLREAVEEGELSKETDAEETSAYLLNSWEGAMLRSKAEASDRPLETFVRMSFDRVLRKIKE